MNTEQEDGEVLPSFDLSAIMKVPIVEPEQTHITPEKKSVVSPTVDRAGSQSLPVRQLLKEAYRNDNSSNPNVSNPVWYVWGS